MKTQQQDSSHCVCRSLPRVARCGNARQTTYPPMTTTKWAEITTEACFKIWPAPHSTTQVALLTEAVFFTRRACRDTRKMTESVNKLHNVIMAPLRLPRTSTTLENYRGILCACVRLEPMPAPCISCAMHGTESHRLLFPCLPLPWHPCLWKTQLENSIASPRYDATTLHNCIPAVYLSPHGRAHPHQMLGVLTVYNS